MEDDCSATYINLRYLAGTVDPSGPAYNFNGEGNTTSLAGNGQVCEANGKHANLAIGDAVIYYNGWGWQPENTKHVAMIYDLNGENPMTMSHGWGGEPAFVTVEDDGRPHQFFKFPNTLRVPAHKPPNPNLPPPKGTPTAAQIDKARLVRLRTSAQERIARSHGWALWYFSEGHRPNPWVPIVGNKPERTAIYANSAYDMMR
jgi:hypothetical protein